MSFSACSDDDEPTPGPEPAPEAQTYHFDIWIALDKHGGMGRDVQTLVKSIDSLKAGSERSVLKEMEQKFIVLCLWKVLSKGNTTIRFLYRGIVFQVYAVE